MGSPVLPITLPISSLIDVTVNVQQAAAQAQSLNSLVIVGTSTIIDTKTRMRTYDTLAAVAADFGTTAPEYLAATLWFDQNPQPNQLFIARWCNVAASGKLIGGALSTAQQAPAVWQAITNGGVDIIVDGVAKNLVGLNFSADANMNAVAATIQVALTGATIVWNAIYNRFEVTSNTTGAASTVAFATAGAGTDISAMLALTAATGAYEANGIAAETALAAVTLLDTDFGQQWYAITVIGASDSDHEAIAPFIEGTTNRHFYGITTQEPAVLTPGDSTDIAAVLKASATSFRHTAVQFSSSSPYAVVSLLARILTTDYTANNSVITLMYKQEPGVTPENLNSTQLAALLAKNCNVFVEYNNNTSIIQPGVCSSGDFIDTIIGTDALAVDVQTAVYNLLFLSPTKIPQTDAGVNQIITTIAAVCSQFVDDGLLAPGVWNGPSFGALKNGDQMPKGFYIFAPPVATQTEAQRSSRVSVPIQIAAKLAGAVHTANVTITVNA